MTYIDELYFKELREGSPEELCSGKSCSYDGAKHKYFVEIWNEKFILDPLASSLSCTHEQPTANHEYFELFVIYYLLKVKPVKTKNEWISEKDLPGGPTFFRGPHLIPTSRISDRYENNLDELKRKCEELGGKAAEMGDVSYSFSITQEIPIRLVYWAGDEDFPAEAKILYDRSIAEMLSLDIIYALAVEICHRLSSN